MWKWQSVLPTGAFQFGAEVIERGGRHGLVMRGSFPCYFVSIRSPSAHILERKFMQLAMQER
jgi:hypothetical protein